MFILDSQSVRIEDDKRYNQFFRRIFIGNYTKFNKAYLGVDQKRLTELAQ